jgi:P4 family phage/plasmid primase-like protien
LKSAPRQPKRDPWEDLPSAVLVQRLLERRWSAVATARGVGLTLGTSWETEHGNTFPMILVVTQGQAGEAAWKALCAAHPDGKVNAPSWRAEGTVVRVLVHPGGDSPRLPSVELVPGVTLVTSGTVDAPGSVTEGHTLLRWQRSAHACDLDPPEAPAWLVRLALDDTARAQSVVAALREMPREEGELNPPRLIRFSEPGDPLPRPSRSFDRGDSVELAHALLADLRAQAPEAGPDAVVYDRGSVWVYDPARGVYGERDRSDLVRALATFAGSPCGPKGKPLSLSDGAIKGAIFTAQNLAARPGYFDAAPHGVACANGFVRVDGGAASVSPHSPAHRATHALEVTYDPAAVCPMWDDALREILRRQVVDESGEVAGLDEDDTLGSVDLIHEFAGASLFGAATVYAVSLVLHGPGNDGKSTILNVLRSLFPPSSVCSIAPQDWTRGFLLAGLAGKLLNVVNELPEREMMEGARFKAVTSGDPLTAERKFGDPFTMRVVAGELFAANDLFPTRDQSAGFWRRFIVVPCTRSFSQSEVVHDLWRKIAAEETAGILARVVEGYARLQGNGRYTTPESSTRAKAEWQVSSDQVRQFVEECCNEVPPGAPSSERATAAELYPVYRAWCGTVGHTPVSQITLAKRLKGLGYFKRVGSAKTYMVRVSAAWQTRAGLTPTAGGGYRAPLN